MASKEKKNYSLNKVDGFNPYEHIEKALDRNGEPIKKKDGTELKYLSTAAKVTWFRMVHPDGIIKTGIVPVEADMGYGAIVRAKALVKFGETEVDWYHQETVYDIADFDKAVSRAQTIALGKALSKAGFGCEVELALDIGSEGENLEEEEKPAKPVEKPKKAKAPKKVDEAKVEADVDDILSDIEAEIAAETAAETEAEEAAQETPEAEVDRLQEALDFKLELNPNAPVVNYIRTLQGKPLGEIIKSHPTFCKLVKEKQNVRNSISEATREAADYIAEYA